MNAHDTTARDIASALMCKPRSAQSVHICSTIFNGSPLGPKYIVLVVPEGCKRGEYYEVWQRGLDALRGGMTPDDLELEPYDDPDGEDDGSAWDREASTADRLYQERMEGIR